MKSIVHQSRAAGSQGVLQSFYSNFKEFEAACQRFRLHQRMGFRSVANAWVSNPQVVVASDPTEATYYHNQHVR